MSKKRALISVFHKKHIEEAARRLYENGWEILSTGGTARHLAEHGTPALEISNLTQFPEILDGRVKTLHPLVFGPILAKNTPEHQEQLLRFSAVPIQLVMVNFYPFEAALSQKHKGLDYMIENIDIGGPSMVRAAAKNHRNVAVVVDAEDYLPVVETLIREGDLDSTTRKRLAAKAFAYTSFYDSLIARYLGEEEEQTPPYMTISGRKMMDLRYGENPHQRGALYIHTQDSPLARMEKLQGKELSFNNILDLSMVYEVINEFITPSGSPEDEDFVVVVKHQNPCGAAIGATQTEAFDRAFSGDPKSAFGGIVGFNKTLDGPTAEKIKDIFFEVIIAPEFSNEALQILRKKKNLRLIQMPPSYRETGDIKTVPGGFVYQDRDNAHRDYNEFTAQTDRLPNEREIRDIRFGWKLIKFVKSNGIIIVRDGMLLGVGAGQMSRVDSVQIALMKSQFPLEDAVLLSDAFFPFSDSIETAAAHKIHVFVEPGGSVRDDEVIQKARELGVSLLFTGMRHFRH